MPMLCIPATNSLALVMASVFISKTYQELLEHSGAEAAGKKYTELHELQEQIRKWQKMNPNKVKVME